MVRLIQRILHAVRIAFPWLVKAFLFTVRLVSLTVASIWTGIPSSVERIANEWLTSAVLAGFPTQWSRYLYYALYALAFTTVITGWILLSYITVWTVNLIF